MFQIIAATTGTATTALALPMFRIYWESTVNGLCNYTRVTVQISTWTTTLESISYCNLITADVGFFKHALTAKTARNYVLQSRDHTHFKRSTSWYTWLRLEKSNELKDWEGTQPTGNLV